MDRKKANKVLGIYEEKPIGVTKKGTILSFARQHIGDVEEIEKMCGEDLIKEWKSLTYMNYIYSCVSLNEIERITLLELEMETREDINKEELSKWYKEAETKHKEQELKEEAKYKNG